MNPSLEQQIQEGIQAVYTKAESDPAFRQLCLSNPKAAVKEATGVVVPDWMRIRFVDGKGAHFTFVLPEPKSTSGELRDEDLEHISGGEEKAYLPLSPEGMAQRRREEAAAKARAEAMALHNLGLANSGLPTLQNPGPGGDITSVKRSLGGGA